MRSGLGFGLRFSCQRFKGARDIDVSRLVAG
mgnify:CR=1 FL=1